jgi:hypothetical protein
MNTAPPSGTGNIVIAGDADDDERPASPPGYDVLDNAGGGGGGAEVTLEPLEEVLYEDEGTPTADEWDDVADEEDVTSGRAEDIERLVRMRLDALEAEYAATVGVPAPPKSTVLRPALSSALASRPDLAAKIDALKRLRLALSSGAEAPSTAAGAASAYVQEAPSNDVEDDDDIPDNFAELQASDSATLAAALARSQGPEAFGDAGGGSLRSGTEGAAAAGGGVDDAFGDFIASVSQSVSRGDSDVGASTESAMGATGAGTEGEDFNPVFPAPAAATLRGGAQRSLRATSPLPDSQRDAILGAMSRLKLNPRVSPFAVKAADAALAAGRRAIASHKSDGRN